MTWETPKTDWTTDDAVGTADLNRIEGNTLAAGLTLGHGNAAENVTAANNLDITATTNIFNITGTTAIKYIKTTGREAGALVFLRFVNNPELQHDQGAAPSGYAKLNIVATFTPSAGSTLIFAYDGTVWFIASRLV